MLSQMINKPNLEIKGRAPQWHTYRLKNKNAITKNEYKIGQKSTQLHVFIQFMLDDLPTQFVAVSVCSRFGLWPFRSVAISVCARSGLWPIRFVAVPVYGHFGLWPLWTETIKSDNIYIASSLAFYHVDLRSAESSLWIASLKISI